MAPFDNHQYLCGILPVCKKNKQLQVPSSIDKQEPKKVDIKLFKKHYDSDPAVLARMWYNKGKMLMSKMGSEI